MIKFQEKLKELRSEMNISQGEVAKSFNVSRTTIHCWECGKQQPDIENIIKLASFFNVSTDYLLGITDEWGNVATSGTISSMQKPSQTLTQDEQQLIEAYRNFSEGKKKALCDMLDIDQEQRQIKKDRL